MQKWEYCRVSQVGSEIYVQVLKPEILGPKTVRSLDGAIAQLGLEGWEMVSHHQEPGRTTTQEFFFKRPI